MSGLVPFNKNRSELLPGGFQNVLDDFFADGWPFNRGLAVSTFKLDIQENEKEYIIDAELPGVKKEDIQLSLEEGTLKIAVSKQEETSEEGTNYLHKERHSTAMARHIYLNDAAAEGIKARLENGVLRIEVPKKEQTTNTVKINVE